jgi:hypothetical protein
VATLVAGDLDLVVAERVSQGFARNDAAVVLLMKLGLAPGRSGLRLRLRWEGRGLTLTMVVNLRAPTSITFFERCHYLPLLVPGAKYGAILV